MFENYTDREIKLAREIAETLNDFDSLSYHLQTVHKFTEEFLRKKLAKVMSIPEHEIRKSRAALYVHLINKSVHYGDARH
jgi:hypothetical protein